jgi:hypothetical protein
LHCSGISHRGEAVADAGFIEAPGTLDDLEAVGRRSPAPNVANAEFNDLIGVEERYALAARLGADPGGP